MHALNENIMRNIRVKSLQEQEKQIFRLLMLCTICRYNVVSFIYLKIQHLI